MKKYKKDTIGNNPLVFSNYEDEYEEFKLHAIGELIKEERKKANLSQEELAEKVHTKKQLFLGLKNIVMMLNYQP